MKSKSKPDTKPEAKAAPTAVDASELLKAQAQETKATKPRTRKSADAKHRTADDPAPVEPTWSGEKILDHLRAVAFTIAQMIFRPVQTTKGQKYTSEPYQFKPVGAGPDVDALGFWRELRDLLAQCKPVETERGGERFAFPVNTFFQVVTMDKAGTALVPISEAKETRIVIHAPRNHQGNERKMLEGLKATLSQIARRHGYQRAEQCSGTELHIDHLTKPERNLTIREALWKAALPLLADHFSERTPAPAPTTADKTAAAETVQS